MCDDLIALYRNINKAVCDRSLQNHKQTKRSVIALWSLLCLCCVLPGFFAAPSLVPLSSSLLLCCLDLSFFTAALSATASSAFASLISAPAHLPLSNKAVWDRSLQKYKQRPGIAFLYMAQRRLSAVGLLGQWQEVGRSSAARKASQKTRQKARRRPSRRGGRRRCCRTRER